jgi:hypothetical protein
MSSKSLKEFNLDLIVQDISRSEIVDRAKVIDCWPSGNADGLNLICDLSESAKFNCNILLFL